MKTKFWLTGLLALSGAVGLFAFASPARADDDDYYYRDGQRQHIRRDLGDIRRDERRLHDLYRQRDAMIRHHDWDDVQYIDREISGLQQHIERDRRDVGHDIHRYRDDRYRDDRYGDYRFRDDRYRDRGDDR